MNDAPRRVRYSVAASLDGYIAGPNGEYDWIPRDPEVDFGALFQQFDTMLVGRRTWETMVAAGQTSMPGMQTVVFSRTLRPENCPGAVLLNSLDALKPFREAPGKDIWLMGGGSLFRSMAEAGLVDSMEVNVAPVLLGAGVPVFPGPALRVKLSLTSTRIYHHSGIVALNYAIHR